MEDTDEAVCQQQPVSPINHSIITQLIVKEGMKKCARNNLYQLSLSCVSWFEAKIKQQYILKSRVDEPKPDFNKSVII